MKSAKGALAGRRVLITEDEYLMAFELAALLKRAGAVVIGPAPSVAQALTLAAAPLDVALLDINLRGELVYPVADLLRARGVPFVFSTGFDSRVIPGDYAGAPYVEKPFRFNRIVEALEEACARPRATPHVA